MLSWRLCAFNGLTQVIVQSTQEPGIITLAASAEGLDAAILTLETTESERNPHRGAG